MTAQEHFKTVGTTNDHPLIARLDDGIAHLTINRPTRRNAVTKAMWLAIAAHVSDLAHNGNVRVLVLSGADGTFSAGADIGEFDEVRRDAASARVYEQANSAAFAAIRNAPFPVIAAIEGICFGGGFGLAAACDIRIGGADALFCVPAARLGLAYPQDAMVDIVSALGPQLARYLAYSAARIDAATAYEAGFLMELCAAGEALTRADEIAAGIAKNAPLSVRASKLSIRAVIEDDEALAGQAARSGDATFDSADYAEGRAAFRDKRTPVFTGR